VIDVRAMQALAQEAWRVAGPRAEWHVGDVAWGRWQHTAREHEWEVRGWDGVWAWLKRPTSTLDWLVHPELKGSPRQREVLEWFESEAEGPTLRTFAFADDEPTREVLAAAGFAPETAAELARNLDIDLHVALDLVKRGCPPETAARILL
jgi:hypothetical protein